MPDILEADLRPPLRACGYRWWTTDFVGLRWIHSCDRDPHTFGLCICTCEARAEMSVAHMPREPGPAFPEHTPEEAFHNYMRKSGGLPGAGEGSDHATFIVARWCIEHVPDMTEQIFVDCVKGERPEFDERWIQSKWRSANRH